MSRISRRIALKLLAGLGVGTGVFRRALAAQVQAAGTVNAEMVRQAEWIAGIELDDDQREATARGLARWMASIERLNAVELDNSVPPAVVFQPAPGQPSAPVRHRPIELSVDPDAKRPESPDDLAFMTLADQARLIRARKISSVELTKHYLERLRRFDPALRCVVTLTEELALEQAARADREIAAGFYRGPLHGIPWGAKDLIAWPGYKTTWGATPYKDRVIGTKATVAARLEEAGAVLIAKLSLGALAQGDRWFDTRTRNPWNVAEGASGSSAGSAAATAAGLVSFALGSETLGSIVSPSTRCGATGLRPTFGRVSRHGCMALAWSMDKIGPIARSVEDCAIVLAAIHGPDGHDATLVDRPFHWPPRRDLRTLRVGYFETSEQGEARPELSVLRDLGLTLVPVQLPTKYPTSALSIILYCEAATAFDELTRQGVTEGLNTWPASFRQGQFIPAVAYLRANRVRTLVMREMEELMSQIDLYVGGNDSLLTNLTGHPTVVVPSGLGTRRDVATPTALTFTGRLFGESELLDVADAYQRATGHHLNRPPLEKLETQDKGNHDDTTD